MQAGRSAASPVQSLPLASQSAVSHVAAHLAAAAAGIATEHIVVGPAADHTVQIAHKAKDLPVAVQHMRHRRSLNTLQGIAGASAPPAAAHQHLHLHMQAVGTALAAHSMVAARCTAHTSGAALGFPSTPTIQFDPKNLPAINCSRSIVQNCLKQDGKTIFCQPNISMYAFRLFMMIYPFI